MANDVKIEITAKDKTKKAISSVNRGFSTLKRSALGVTSVIASTLAAVSGVTTFKSIDALAKTSDKLGLTTEALISLRHAAEQTGVATNTLDMALQRMTRRIAEAAQGTGEAKTALRELGLDARALALMSPDQAFKEIAGAMKDVGGQSDKVRLAFKLFDSEGVNLVNTLALGKTGLNDMEREAESLGLTLSRVDAHKIEEAGNAISRATGFVEGLVNKIIVTLSPAVTDVANAFVNLGTAIKDALDGGSTKPRQIGFMLELKKAAEGLSLAFLKIKLNIVKLLATYLTSFDTKLSNTSDEVYKQTLAFLEASDALDDYNAGLIKAANANINLDPNKQLPKPIQLEQVKFEFDVDGATGFNAQMNQMALAIGDVDTQAVGFIDRFSTGLSTQLTQALMTGQFSFKQFALSIIADLTAMIIKAIIFTQIQAGLKAIGFGGLLGGASGGNVTAAKGKASGGGLNRGKPFMVGEQGRELFIPKTDGHLVPNHKLDGGEPLSVTFNINAIDTQTGVGFLVNNKQSIIGMIDQAYRKQGRRGVSA
jgi:hypothetical protein